MNIRTEYTIFVIRHSNLLWEHYAVTIMSSIHPVTFKVMICTCSLNLVYRMYWGSDIHVLVCLGLKAFKSSCNFQFHLCCFHSITQEGRQAYYEQSYTCRAYIYSIAMSHTVCSTTFNLDEYDKQAHTYAVNHNH